jgi:thiamine-phosphate pyrophosphorylase
MTTFRLYLITDRRLAAPHGGLLPIDEAALAASAETMGVGATAVQLREKDLNARPLYELACALRDLCARYRAPLLINDRIDVAIAARADGVHLPANSFAIGDARALLGPSRMIGVSTHKPAEAAAAIDSGADFAVYGPVYDPVSKPAYGPAAGPANLARAVEVAGAMPLYALGGVTADRVQELTRTLDRNHRPHGVAVIGAIFGAANPAKAARQPLNALRDW